jgi:hypothetical protein
MEKNINYKGLFAAGGTFLAAGVALMISLGPVGVGLIGIGLVMMAVGLVNRQKWDREA